MTWTKLSDDHTDRPELLEVSRSARHLLTELLVYSNRMLTDGRIAAGAIRRITDSPDFETELLELESAGWVTLVDNGRAYQVDWSEQEPAAEIKARRESTRERKRRSRQHAAGDHSLCLPAYCKSAVTHPVTRDETRSSRRGSRTPDPPVPARRSRDGEGGRKRCANGAIIADDGTCCAQQCSSEHRAAS